MSSSPEGQHHAFGSSVLTLSFLRFLDNLLILKTSTDTRHDLQSDDEGRELDFGGLELFLN
jgi:hypothetical protein